MSAKAILATRAPLKATLIKDKINGPKVLQKLPSLSNS